MLLIKDGLLTNLFNIMFSLTVLVLFSPVMLAVCIMILVSMGSPVLFRQERVGYGLKIFKIYKFRTMSNAENPDGTLKSDEERLTKTGKFLRRTSLDELPQLFNIIKRDMNLVEPRPLLTEYLPLYSEKQILRHSVRPGLTGLAQINGRNALSWKEKFEYDNKYVRQKSFFTDLKIIAKTFIYIFNRKGITGFNSATTEKFNGRN